MKNVIADGYPRRLSGKVAVVAALALTSGAPCATAQGDVQGTATPGRYSREEVRFETLRPDNAFRDWVKAYQTPAAFAAGGGLYTQSVGHEGTEGQHEMIAGYYVNLSDSLSSLVETSYLPNPQGTTEWSVLGQMGARFGDGWGMQAGLRHSALGLWGQEGRRLDAQLGLLTLEKVWSSYRSQYTVYTSRRDNGLTGGGHRVSLDYLYGSGSTVGLTYGRAWAADTFSVTSAGAAPISSNVGVTGEHWLTRDWSVNYDALFQQSGDANALAPELRVGLRLAF